MLCIVKHFSFTIIYKLLYLEGKKRADGQSDEQDADGECTQGEATTGGKGKQRKKFKSCVTNEDSITLAPQTDNIILKPHGNFELIKSTFSGSATAQKLIDHLPLGSDFCCVSVARSPTIFRPKHPTNVTKYRLIKAEKALLEKMTKMSLPIAPELERVMLSQSVDSLGNLHYLDKTPGNLEGSFLGALGPQSPSSPSEISGNSLPAGCLDFDANSPEQAVSGTDSFAIGNAGNPLTPIFKGHVNTLTEQFCSLDITALFYSSVF